MDNFNHNRWFVIFILSTIIFLGSLIIKPLLVYVGYWDFFTSSLASTVINAEPYDSHAKGKAALPQTLKISHDTATNIANEDTDIQFQFMFYSLYDYEDLFQTAPYNEGIRLEAGKTGSMGILSSANQENQPFVSALVTHVYFPLFYSFTPNTWHSMRVHAWNKKIIVVWLDDVRVATIQDASINYKMSDVIIGKGFDNSRIFNGKIRNFTLKHDWLNPAYNKMISNVFIVMALTTFMLSIFSLVKSIPSQLTKNEKILLLSLIVLIGFIAMSSYNFISSVYLGKSYPYNSFLISPSFGAFSDYYLLPILAEGLNPYFGVSAHSAIYLPFAYLFTYPTVWIPHLYLFIMNTIFTLGTIIFVRHYFSMSLNAKEINLINAKNIFILSFLTYPFLFSFERGNIEVFVFLLLALSLYFYQTKQLYKSATTIAMCTAMKLFPILMLLLFIADKKYKQALFSIGVFILLTSISLMMFEGGFYKNLMAFIQAVQVNDIYYSTYPLSIHWSPIDMLSFIKYIYYEFYHAPITLNVATNYHMVILLSVLLMAGYITFIEKIFWKKVTLIVCAMLLFPIISFQYKLMHLFLPLACFINDSKEPEDRYDNFYLLMFALILIPTNYFYFDHNLYAFSNLIDTSILGLLMVTIMGGGIYQYCKIKK